MRRSYFLLVFSFLFIMGCNTTNIENQTLITTKKIDELLSSKQIIVKSINDIAKNSLPKETKLGDCYAQVLTPPQYKIVTENIPQKQTLYKTETKKVLLKDEYYKEIQMPDKYEYKTQKTFTYKTISTPRGDKQIQIPKVEVIKVKVEDGKINKVKIPAVFKMVPKKVPYEQIIYKTQTKKELINDEKIELKRVLCESDYSKEFFLEIQKKLKVFQSGQFDKETKRAITTFQKKHNLSIGGLTYESIKALEKVR